MFGLMPAEPENYTDKIGGTNSGKTMIWIKVWLSASNLETPDITLRPLFEVHKGLGTIIDTVS